MDEKTLSLMVALGAIPEEQALLMRQRSFGEGLTDTPMAQGRNVGHTYVASSPLEHIANAMQRVIGYRKMQGAEQGYRDTLARQTQARGAYAQSLLDALKPRQQQPPQSVPPLWDATAPENLPRFGPGY